MSKVAYRRMVPTFWTDPDVKRPLTRDQKCFLIYLFTNPHGHPVGVYHLPLLYVTDELGFTPAEAMEMFSGACARFATYDQETEEVFVHAMAEHQIDGGLHGQDKRIPWVMKQLATVRSSKLLDALRRRYAQWNIEWAQLPRSTPPTPHGNGSTKPQAKGHTKAHTKGHAKALPKGSTKRASGNGRKATNAKNRNGPTKPKTKGLGKPAAATATDTPATATDNVQLFPPDRIAGARAEGLHPEQRDGLSTERRTATARERAARIFATGFHRGRDVVQVGDYRETLEVALDRWDREVDSGRDPDELNDELALVRTVENFPVDEPITSSVYFGPDRHETRHLCSHERLKRMAPGNLPAVNVDPPLGESWTEKQQAARRQLESLRAAARRASA